ncbi:MAG: response regulator transcription factor [Flavobacteriales bacterium]
MSGAKLVIVDDEEDILFLLKYNLINFGFQVSQFTSSLEALSYIKNNPTDLILSDWMMPEPNGIEFCRIVRSSPFASHIPFVMLTCKSTSRDEDMALKAGVDEFLTKPIRMNELAEKLNKVLSI